MYTELKRSNDRKTTTAANAAGTQSTLKNAFGLPAGRAFSCVGATDYCESICYGLATERYLPSVRALLMHNYEALKGASRADMVLMLTDMITGFVKEADRKGAEKLFRIHWDGDFFSLMYTTAWADVVASFPDVQFWVYTRVAASAAYLAGRNISNLALYFSADRDNAEVAASLHKEYGVLIATVEETFDEAQFLHTAITGDRVGRCPEVAGRIPLITTKGGACATCRLCPMGKVDITFSRTGK